MHETSILKNVHLGNLSPRKNEEEVTLDQVTHKAINLDPRAPSQLEEARDTGQESSS